MWSVLCSVLLLFLHARAPRARGNSCPMARVRSTASYCTTAAVVSGSWYMTYCTCHGRERPTLNLCFCAAPPPRLRFVFELHPKIHAILDIRELSPRRAALRPKPSCGARSPAGFGSRSGRPAVDCQIAPSASAYAAGLSVFCSV